MPKTETIHHQYDSEDLVLVSEEDGFWLDEEILSDQTDTHTAYAQFANCKGGGRIRLSQISFRNPLCELPVF